MKLLEELKDILALCLGCLTSFWFWLPIIFAGYMWFQLYLMFYVHPLTIVIVPVAMILFASFIKRQREEALIQLYLSGYKFKDPVKMVEIYKQLLEKQKKEAKK